MGKQPCVDCDVDPDGLRFCRRCRTVAAIAARMRSEILADITSGRLPDDVASFSALHGHVDANGYGGCNDEDCPLSPLDVGMAQDITDRWLRARMVRQRARDEHYMAMHPWAPDCGNPTREGFHPAGEGSADA